MVSFSKELEVYLEKYATSKKIPEWFEIKIPIVYASGCFIITRKQLLAQV
jgi:hypothetical protein